MPAERKAIKKNQNVKNSFQNPSFSEANESCKVNGFVLKKID